MIRPILPRDYQLHIPEEIERRLRRCRSSIRQAIHSRLAKIAKAEATKLPLHRRRLVPPNPPLRFYASESYRISYHIDRLRRTVVVLALRKEVEG
jgi:hypothetical protein